MHVAKDIFGRFIYRNILQESSTNIFNVFFFFFVIYLNHKRPSIDLKEH